MIANGRSPSDKSQLDVSRPLMYVCVTSRTAACQLPEHVSLRRAILPELHYNSAQPVIIHCTYAGSVAIKVTCQINHQQENVESRWSSPYAAVHATPAPSIGGYRTVITVAGHQG